jgi:hypothetical protein
VLLLDRSAALWQQHLLGLGTWLVLLAVLRVQDRATRVQVAVVVAFATVVELVFAGWLGVYVYRLDNVPAFVPPGHGLVYLAALSIGRSAWAHAHARVLLRSTLVAGGAWALWGVTLADRPDALGAFWYGCLLLFAWRGRSPLLYAGAFLVVSGSSCSAPRSAPGPGDGRPFTWWISIGNPPSASPAATPGSTRAALYATPRLLRRGARRRCPSRT